MEESFSARPLVGRWLALDLRPTRPLTLLGPAWAVVCGAIASGSLLLRWQTALLIIFSLLLADVLLGAWRVQWLLPDWREAVRRSMSNAPAWFIAPDLETERAIARFWRQATRRLHFFRTILWPLIESETVGMFMIGALALCVASVLGQLPLLLCAAAMALALVEGQIEGERAEWLRAIYEITFPWLIAQAAFGFFSWLSVAFVLLFTLVYRGLLGLSSARQNHWLLVVNLAQLAAALVLFAKGAPAIAGVATLTLLAQVLWQTRYRVSRDGRGYVQRTQSYVLVAMLVTGVALWF